MYILITYEKYKKTCFLLVRYNILLNNAIYIQALESLLLVKYNILSIRITNIQAFRKLVITKIYSMLTNAITSSWGLKKLFLIKNSILANDITCL